MQPTEKHKCRGLKAIQYHLLLLLIRCAVMMPGDRREQRTAPCWEEVGTERWSLPSTAKGITGEVA